MIDQVTILAYFFCPCDAAPASFDKLRQAIVETWRHCGKLHTVIVANARHACVSAFANDHKNVEIQVEPSLVPGDIYTMSVDCNSRLYSRFSTPYVLVIQNDGYPLRSGLEEFVGKYDFIGAPYVRDTWWRNLICGVLGYWVQNGGFSLRSHRICAAAAKYWHAKYAAQGQKPCFAEDLYYTQFLPLHEWGYRKFRLATNRESIRFSWDAIVPIPCPAEKPFGFHRDISLQKLMGKA